MFGHTVNLAGASGGKFKVAFQTRFAHLARSRFDLLSEEAILPAALLGRLRLEQLCNYIGGVVNDLVWQQKRWDFAQVITGSD